MMTVTCPTCGLVSEPTTAGDRSWVFECPNGCFGGHKRTLTGFLSYSTPAVHTPSTGHWSMPGVCKVSEPMSRRDHFAAAAMEGLLSRVNAYGPCHEYAQKAVQYADSLIAELDKTKP